MRGEVSLAEDSSFGDLVSVLLEKTGKAWKSKHKTLF
jgi:hypothetical protein